MKIAIVGSEGKYWTPAQRTKVIQEIKEILTHDDYIDVNPADPGDVEYPTLVSGGCGSMGENKRFYLHPGVDGWAEMVADFIGLDKDIKYAKVKGWESRVVVTNVSGELTDEWGKGYRERNLDIARDCDALYCIDPSWREWSGGRWTMKEAEKLDKEVYLVLIE